MADTSGWEENWRETLIGTSSCSRLGRWTEFMPVPCYRCSLRPEGNVRVVSNSAHRRLTLPQRRPRLVSTWDVAAIAWTLTSFFQFLGTTLYTRPSVVLCKVDPALILPFDVSQAQSLNLAVILLLIPTPTKLSDSEVS